MSVRVIECLVDTVQGPKKAWVSEPTEHMSIGRQRLVQFRSEGHPGSDLDRELLTAVREIGDPHQLVVFRTGAWLVALMLLGLGFGCLWSGCVRFWSG